MSEPETHTPQPGANAPQTQAALTLAGLAPGESAEVAAISEECRGFGRQRLFDLGLTPGTRVRVAMENAFGDPRAYQVRGTLLALRRELAEQVRVRRADARDEKNGE
jgi:DtxR family Mn-dependent transcriptional regulator